MSARKGIPYDDIRDMLDDGKTVIEIAEHYGCSTQNIRQRIQKGEENMTVEELREKGYTVAKIAEIMKMDIDAVRDELGITPKEEPKTEPKISGRLTKVKDIMVLCGGFGEYECNRTDRVVTIRNEGGTMAVKSDELQGLIEELIELVEMM